VNKLPVLLLIIILFSSLVGCATTSSTSVPDWVQNPPRQEGDSYVFVAYGRDPSGDELKARENAEDSLVSQIVREFGVKITSESTTEARATLDSFSADIKRRVTSQGSAVIRGFRIGETFQEDREDEAVVWIKAYYEKEAFDVEKARILALFKEIEEAVSGPEREGDALLEQGKNYQALIKYLEAARGAAQNDMDNSQIRLERNLNKAREALSGLVLRSLNSQVSTFLKDPLLEDFEFRLQKGPDPEDPPVEGADILVTYSIRLPNGRVGTRSRVLVTDDQGRARFTHPPSQLIGPQRVTARLSTGAMEDLLESLEDSPALEALRNQINQIRADAVLMVESAASRIPTAVLILDVDNGGSPTGRAVTESGLRAELSQEGFTLISVEVDRELLMAGDNNLILDRIKRDYGDAVQRVVLGVSSLEEFNEDDGTYLVRVSGSIEVLDTETREIIYSTRRFKRTQGQGFDAALNSAFRQLGGDIAEKLQSELP